MQKQDREGCDAVPRDTGRVAPRHTHALATRARSPGPPHWLHAYVISLCFVQSHRTSLLVSLELNTRYTARAQGYIPPGYLDGASLRYVMGWIQRKIIFRKEKNLKFVTHIINDI